MTQRRGETGKRKKVEKRRVSSEKKGGRRTEDGGEANVASEQEKGEVGMAGIKVVSAK